MKIKKRILSSLTAAVCALTLCNTVFTGVTAVSAGITIGDTVVENGTSKATVDISLSGLEKTRGCQFKITYPGELTLVEEPAGAMAVNSSGNTVSVVFAASSGSEFTGQFSEMTFSIPEGVSDVKYPIEITDVKIVDNGKYVENPVGVSGSITVQAPVTTTVTTMAATVTTTVSTTAVSTTVAQTTVPVTTAVRVHGDISGNNEIDLYDAIEIAKNLLGTRKFSSEEEKIADYNKDGKVDLYDAIAIAKYILENK